MAAGTAGVELVDTVTINMESGAPLALPDRDSRSVTSIDRSPPKTVNALDCLRNVRLPLVCVSCCHSSGRRESLNDDSPTFTGSKSFQHELNFTDVSYLSNKNVHALYCESSVVDGACYNTVPDRSLHQVQNTNHLVPNRNVASVTYAQPIGNAPVVNPVPKPWRQEVQDPPSWCKETEIPPGYDEARMIPSSLSDVSHTLPNGQIGEAKVNCSEETLVQERAPPYNMPEIPEQSNTGIVYLNRRPSDEEISNRERKGSFAEMLDSYLDKKLNLSDVNVDLDHDVEATENDKLLQESNPLASPAERDLKDFNAKTLEMQNKRAEAERIPLIKKQKPQFRKARPPNLVHVKSFSFEQAERSYDSDDSIGNAGSLASQSSMLSRLSKLSVTMCPPVRIDPSEARTLGHKDTRGKHPLYLTKGTTASLPARKLNNTAYVTYSSFDTEPSEIGSSSSESLPQMSESANSPRDQDRNGGSSSEKSARNVAMGSLKNKGKTKQMSIVRSDEDSGRESWTREANGSHRLQEDEHLQFAEELHELDVNGRMDSEFLHSTPRSLNHCDKTDSATTEMI